MNVKSSGKREGLRLPRLAMAVRAVGLSTVFIFVACGDGGEVTGPGTSPDVDALFRPPTPQEAEAVESDWESRTTSVDDVRVLSDDVVTSGTELTRIRVVSHLVDGLRHHGILSAPIDAGVRSVPILVYAHGGDGGVAVAEVLLLDGVLKSMGRSAAIVAPAFRGEPVRVDEESFLSDGPPSPWDRDVDDAIALLSASIQTAPELDPERIGIVGFSRGGGVGLLMAARDPRIDAVVEFFGPTDFFDEYVREIVEEALRGNPRDLPGLDYLNETVIQPWQDGTLPTEEARLEMVRRSAVYFVDRLPAVQLHHGTADEVVAVSQAERLIEAMEAAGRTESNFEAFLYMDGGHSLLNLPEAIDRTVDFLDRHVFQVPSSARSVRPRLSLLKPERR